MPQTTTATLVQTHIDEYIVSRTWYMVYLLVHYAVSSVWDGAVRRIARTASVGVSAAKYTTSQSLALVVTIISRSWAIFSHITTRIISPLIQLAFFPTRLALRFAVEFKIFLVMLFMICAVGILLGIALGHLARYLGLGRSH